MTNLVGIDFSIALDIVVVSTLSFSFGLARKFKVSLLVISELRISENKLFIASGPPFLILYIGDFCWYMEKCLGIESRENGQIYHMVLFQQWFERNHVENYIKKLSIRAARLFESLVGNVSLKKKLSEISVSRY